MKKILIILFLAQISCAEKEKNYIELQMISKRIVEIPLDNSTSGSWAFMQYFNNANDEFLVFHDYLKSDEKYIHFANINDRKRSFKTKIFKDGPNGVGSLDGFHVRSLDSIFVLNRFGYHLYMLDTSGVIKNRFPLISNNSKDTSVVTYLPGIFSETPILSLGNNLFIPASPDLNPLEMNYESSKTGFLLNLKTKNLLML